MQEPPGQPNKLVMRSQGRLMERAVKSFGFSLVLFLLWGTLTVSKTRALFGRFDALEVCWLLYNVTIAILFLIRMRPSVVSLEPTHWLVALVTSFSGLFFVRAESLPTAVQASLAGGIILVGLVGGWVAALALGRSYDFLPALRGLQTAWVYGIVRHPMYVSSIVIRAGYVIQNPLAPNVCLWAAVIWLYDRRARYEEAIMNEDPRYQDYCERVRFRFVPRLY